MITFIEYILQNICIINVIIPCIYNIIFWKLYITIHFNLIWSSLRLRYYAQNIILMEQWFVGPGNTKRNRTLVTKLSTGDGVVGKSGGCWANSCRQAWLSMLQLCRLWPQEGPPILWARLPPLGGQNLGTSPCLGPGYSDSGNPPLWLLPKPGLILSR